MRSSYGMAISTERLVLTLSIALSINPPGGWRDVIVDIKQYMGASEILESTVMNFRKRRGPRGSDPRFTVFKVQNYSQLMRSAPQH